MTHLDWRTAQRLAKMQKQEEAQTESFKKTDRELAKMLESVGAPSPEKAAKVIVDPTKPFYSSRVRIEAALEGATMSDMKRVVKKVQELLDVMEEEHAVKMRAFRTEQLLLSQYRKDTLGCSSFQEFVELIRNN